jgi:hypothetical protein
VKLTQRICALLLLSVLAGQACNKTAKPQEAAKPKDAATPQAVKSKGAATPQTAKLEATEITLIEARELLDENFLDQMDNPKIEEELAKTRASEKWLGLYVTEGGSSLIESKVTVKHITRPRYPGAEELLKGDIISVDNPAKPVFLVRDAAMLKPGPAPTIYQGGKAAEHALMDGPEWKKNPRQLKLGDQEYQLKVFEREVDENVVDLKLALVSGKQTQILFTESAHLDHTEFYWRLLWAGDADGDGKLDLYVDSSREDDNSARTALYLSSQAKPGQLVKEVATLGLRTPWE